jgi:hypothetical protein
MTAFEFLSVALSFVLGLAVTLLLTSLLSAFRARHKTKLDWVPFVWAGYALAFQFQFWWAIFELSALPRWTVAMFSLSLLLVALLFLAGGLVLPSGMHEYPADLRAYFETDGRWGAGSLGLYHLVALFANLVLFESPLTDRLHAVSLAAAVVAGLIVWTGSRKMHVALTLAFGVLTALALVWATRPAY